MVTAPHVVVLGALSSRETKKVLALKYVLRPHSYFTAAQIAHPYINAIFVTVLQAMP